MNSLIRKVAVRSVVAAAVFAGTVSLVAVPVALALGTLAGPAQIVAGDFVTPISHLASTTNFSTRLPGGAHCTGDTANQGFTVYSYIVPATVDPATLTYNAASGPSAGFPLVDNGGVPYEARNTAPNTGQIFPTGPPTFNFSIFAGQFTAGSYKMGISCADKNGNADLFFNRNVTITLTSSDPNGFVIDVVPPNDIPESPLAIALPISAVVVGMGAYIVYRRRRHSESVVEGA